MTATRSEYRDERRVAVLRVIVHTYIASGEPTSSRAIAELLPSSLSSATVRNVMAELEDLGFLAQPHTSAGRIPTEKGFRHYADLLLHELDRGAAGAETPAESDLVCVSGNVGELLSEASRALARGCGGIGVVLYPRIGNTRFHIARFLRLDRSRVVAVVVGEEGVVADRIIAVDTDYRQDELDRISNYVTNRFRGGTLAVVRRTLERELKEDRAACDSELRRCLVFALDAFGCCDANGEIFLDGPGEAARPEDAERLGQLLRAYTEKDRIAALLGRCLDRDGVQVVIGSNDNSASQGDGFPGLAVVAVRYGEAGRPLGSVGVLGSTRMHYDQVIPLVDRVAKNVGAALASGLASSN